MTIKKILPLVFLGAMFCVGIPYLALMMGATDDGASVSSDYQDQYDTTTDLVILTLSMAKFIVPLIGFLILIVILGVYKKKIKF